MTKKTSFFLKALIISLIVLSPFALICSISFAAESIIIDHTCTDITQISEYWLEKAKELTIHYAHTSHGSQINSGILNLESQDSKYSVVIRTSSSAGLPPVEDPLALRMYDGNPPETYISPDDYWDGESGKDRTRVVADTGDYDFSMWSWCGQVSGASESYIQNYLDTLNQFENEYPGMRFIYMTGHLDGTGSTGNLHVRNKQIRNYCIANNKVLFDFADIERYDPDGADYLDLGANDNCDYNSGNWADEWCAANPGSDLCASCSCAHSKSLNCNIKARAFWWMMARLAGWNPGTSSNVLTVTIPESATEGDGVLTGQGTVSIPETLESGLAVLLASGDITELTVPSTATINAGKTSATFDLTIVDDTEIDGTQSVAVTASADGWIIGTDTIAVVDNDDTGGSCFIATAAYGSRMEPHLKILCEFRDRFLLTNAGGKSFVDIYYTYSPPVADFITRNDMLQTPVRWALLPLVAVAYLTLHFGPASALVFMLVLLALMIAAVYKFTHFSSRLKIRRRQSQCNPVGLH